MISFRSLSKLSDNELLEGLVRLANDHAQLTAAVVAHLAQVDERRLFAREGFPSLFSQKSSARRSLIQTRPGGPPTLAR
jgi:hypothetical protein